MVSEIQPNPVYIRSFSEGENSVELMLNDDNSAKVIINLASYKSIHMFSAVNTDSFYKFSISVKDIIEEHGYTSQSRLLLLRAISWI